MAERKCPADVREDDVAAMAPKACSRYCTFKAREAARLACARNRNR